MKRKKLKVFVIFSGGASGGVFVMEQHPGYGKDFEIVGGFCNSKDAKGIQYIPNTVCIDYGNWCTARKLKRSWKRAQLLYAIDMMKNIPDDVDVILLAGYMRILPVTFLRKFQGRIINVHPARLDKLDSEGVPLYTGDDAVEKALRAGETHTASTVHFATKKVDCGKIICISDELEYDPNDTYSEHQEKMKTACDGPAIVQAINLILSGEVQLGQKLEELPETRVLLVHNHPHDLAPIGDYLEMIKLTNDIVLLSYCEEAVASVPASGSCVIILDSRILSNRDVGPVAAARLLALESKIKNPKCKTILYTGDTWDLPESLFDSVIKITDHDSYERVMETLLEYSLN